MLLRDADHRVTGLRPSPASDATRAAAWRHAAAAAVVRLDEALAEVREATVRALVAEREGGGVLVDSEVKAWVDGVRGKKIGVEHSAQAGGTSSNSWGGGRGTSGNPQDTAVADIDASVEIYQDSAMMLTQAKYPEERPERTMLLRLYPTQRDRLARAAKRLGLPVTEYLRLALEEKLEKDPAT